MINKLLVYVVSLYLVLTPTIYAAAPSPSGGGWGPPTVTRVALTDVIEATARQQAIRNGTAVTLEAVVQETINRNSVGRVLLKRLLAGGLLIGATQALVEGVGWVMEDGVYVKYKNPKENPNTPPNVQYYWETQLTTGPFYSEISSVVFSARANDLCKEYSSCTSSSYKINDSSILLPTYVGLVGSSVSINLNFSNGATSSYPMSGTQRKKNPNYNPSAPQPEKERILLTPDLVGGLAVGDYTDPVDSTKNKKDKVWTDVENAYKPDVTGNDLNERINNKFDDAPETNSKPTNKPKVDGDGQKYPAPDKKPGGQGETDNKTDPDTGEQKGTFTLPDWCIWAADQCQWHKEDKKHQEEETTFWGDVKNFFMDVKNWFDWSKQEPELKDEELEIEDKSITDYERKDYVTFAKTCPFSPHQVSLPLGVLGELSFESDLTFICTFGNEARPFVIGLGYLGGLIFLLIGLRNGNG